MRFLEMEASGLYLFFLFAVQDDRVQLLTRGSVASSLTISAEAEEVTAHQVLDILLRDKFVFSIIDQLAERLVHGLVSVTTDKDIDALKTVSGSVVDVVLRLMLHSEDIASLLALFDTYMTDPDIHESALAPISVFDAESYSDVVEWEVICILACSVVLVISVYDAEHFILVFSQVLDPPPLLLGRSERLSIYIRLGRPGSILALVACKDDEGVGSCQQLLKFSPLLLIKLRGAGVDVCSEQDLDPLQLRREIDDYGLS